MRDIWRASGWPGATWSDDVYPYYTPCTNPSKTPWMKAKKDTTTERMPQKARLMLAKTFLDKSQPFWDNVPWIDKTKVESFRKVAQHCVYRWRNEAYKRKNTTYSKTRWRFYHVVDLLCCPWYWRQWMYQRNNEINKLPRYFRVTYVIQCPKTFEALDLSAE